MLRYVIFSNIIKVQLFVSTNKCDHFRFVIKSSFNSLVFIIIVVIMTVIDVAVVQVVAVCCNKIRYLTFQ